VLQKRKHIEMFVVQLATPATRIYPAAMNRRCTAAELQH